MPNLEKLKSHLLLKYRRKIISIKKLVDLIGFETRLKINKAVSELKRETEKLKQRIF